VKHKSEVLWPVLGDVLSKSGREIMVNPLPTHVPIKPCKRPKGVLGAGTGVGVGVGVGCAFLQTIFGTMINTILRRSKKFI